MALVNAYFCDFEAAEEALRALPHGLGYAGPEEGSPIPSRPVAVQITVPEQMSNGAESVHSVAEELHRLVRLVDGVLDEEIPRAWPRPAKA